jgi:hypothetical protein
MVAEARRVTMAAELMSSEATGERTGVVVEMPAAPWAGSSVQYRLIHRKPRDQACCAPCPPHCHRPGERLDSRPLGPCPAWRQRFRQSVIDPAQTPLDPCEWADHFGDKNRRDCRPDTQSDRAEGMVASRANMLHPLARPKVRVADLPGLRGCPASRRPREG